MKKPATVHDVARQSGVSTATISRYFNGKIDALSPKTLARVEKAVQELNYTPSQLGRSLRLSQSNIVVMLVPDATNFFTADIAVSVENAIREQGRTLVLANTSENATNQDKLLSDAIGMRADSIILQGAIDTPKLRSIVKQQHCIFVNRRPSNQINAPYVGVDNFKAGEAVGQYFLSKGYENIVAIHGPRHFGGSISRLDGFIKGIGETKHVQEIESSYSMDDGHRAAQALFASNEQQYSIFCGNDMIAYGVHRAAVDAGLRVPQDVKIFGFDGNRMNAWLAPWLSTVRVRTDLYGPAIADLIARKAEWSDLDRNVIFPFDMVLSHSA